MQGGRATVLSIVSQAPAEGRPVAEQGATASRARERPQELCPPSTQVGERPRVGVIPRSRGDASRPLMKELRGLKDWCPPTAPARKESGEGGAWCCGPAWTRKSSAETRPSCPNSGRQPEAGLIRKQPSGSGNSREDPEAVSAVTRECGALPFAQRRWRQLRRRPRARMASDCGRGLCWIPSPRMGQRLRLSQGSSADFGLSWQEPWQRWRP